MLLHCWKKHLKPLTIHQNTRDNPKSNVKWSNMNEVSVKHLHPSRTRSSEFNKVVGKFRLEGPSGGLQCKAQGFLKNLGSENIHRPTAVFPDNMRQCLFVLTEKEVCLTFSLNLTSFKLFLFSPILLSNITVRSLTPSIASCRSVLP